MTIQTVVLVQTPTQLNGPIEIGRGTHVNLQMVGKDFSAQVQPIIESILRTRTDLEIDRIELVVRMRERK